MVLLSNLSHAHLDSLHAHVLVLAHGLVHECFRVIGKLAAALLWPSIDANWLGAIGVERRRHDEETTVRLSGDLKIGSDVWQSACAC